jgi:hypothetical protein
MMMTMTMTGKSYMTATMTTGSFIILHGVSIGSLVGEDIASYGCGKGNNKKLPQVESKQE